MRSRLDAGAVQPEIGAIELDRILSALRIEFAHWRGQTASTWPFPPRGCGFAATCGCRRILQNFISNAIRYTDQGSVEVGAEVAGDDIVIAVRDTGPGIAKEKQGAIFEEFRRLEGNSHRPGNGLGLAIVRRSCAILGYPIALDVPPGCGLCVRDHGASCGRDQPKDGAGCTALSRNRLTWRGGAGDQQRRQHPGRDARAARQLGDCGGDRVRPRRPGRHPRGARRRGAAHRRLSSRQRTDG